MAAAAGAGNGRRIRCQPMGKGLLTELLLLTVNRKETILQFFVFVLHLCPFYRQSVEGAQ